MSSPIIPANSRVTVLVPHEVAYDIEKMRKVTSNVLARLGCPGCHSGRVIDFQVFQHYVADAKTLEVMPHVGPAIGG